LSSGGETTQQPQTISYDPQPTSTTVDGQLIEQIDDTATVEDNDDIPVVLPTINARNYDTDEAVKANRAELKIEEKLMYDKAHKFSMGVISFPKIMP